MLRKLFFQAVNHALRENSHFYNGGGSDLSPPCGVACRAKPSLWLNVCNSHLEMLTPEPFLCILDHGLCSWVSHPIL